jgi:hypothetical protein
MRLLKKFQFDNTSDRKIFPVFPAKEECFAAHFRNKPASRRPMPELPPVMRMVFL